MQTASRDRSFSGLLILLIAAGGFFGLAPLVFPTQFADVSGFAGKDVFMYRVAGAATFGYAVGLAAGFRSGWTALRIPIVATFVFNAASVVACLVAIIGGGAQPVVYLILVASVLFTASTGYFLANPPGQAASAAAESTSASPDMAPWMIGLFAIGTAAAAFFGLAALIPAGAFGHLLGYPGLDDFVYRQGGAATLGAAVGGATVLMSRRWESARIPAQMALTFNGLSVIAALLEITSGGQPIAWLILAAAGLVTVGSATAIARGGR
jgi:hypothetical protein